MSYSVECPFCKNEISLEVEDGRFEQGSEDLVECPECLKDFMVLTEWNPSFKLTKIESKCCECDTAMIQRDQETQKGYCFNCKKEIVEAF